MVVVMHRGEEMDGFYNILQSLARLNYDNGRTFTKRDRLDAIDSLLKASKYKRVNKSGLFELYAYNGKIPTEAVLLSTHVDCVMSKCFARDHGGEYLIGTFDNLITNAVAVKLMLDGELNENVIVAFTGDEEENSAGAVELVRFLRKKGTKFRVVVLDVTDMGWSNGSFFTVENDFWENSFGETVIGSAEGVGCKWSFVPSDEDDVPDYIPQNAVIPIEAECDESWEYDEHGIQCFSLCIPVCGNMHSDEGVLIRRGSVGKYSEALRIIANSIIIR